jgi:chromosome segregation ATPase
MNPTDITIEILKDIRGEVRKTNERLDQTNERLDQMNGQLGARIDKTNERIDQTNERLEVMREELSRRIVESEIRTSTAIADLAGTVRELTSVLRASADLRPRVDKCEEEIAEIKKRLPGPKKLS